MSKMDNGLFINNSGGFLGLVSDRVTTLVRQEPMTDHYNVDQRPFARGKFATVRRCRHKETNIDYAAKFIRKRRRAMDVRHEILHEIAVLELCRPCPDIVQLHEVYETGSEIVLVLELAAGGEMQRLIDEDEVLSEKDVIRFMRQILEGLVFMHDRNIAHLDIKPQNLLLTRAYPHCDIKLCDFGISRLITKGIEIREIMGTPDYVAPEVLNYEPISLPTDMWSVGVLTYVLLTGHSPFAGDNKQETFCNISHVNLDFPDDLFHHISCQAKDFIRKLLVKETSDRLTARDSLCHPWLRQQPDTSTGTTDNSGNDSSVLKTTTPTVTGTTPLSSTAPPPLAPPRGSNANYWCSSTATNTNNTSVTSRDSSCCDKENINVDQLDLKKHLKSTYIMDEGVVC